jgi:hypothetical protein
LAIAHAAHAQQAEDGVVLHVPDCLGASGAEVKKLVSLELAPRLRVLDEGGALRGRVVCSAPRVTISVEDAARATPLRIELDLQAAAPEARQRLLALTLAELISTRQLERAENARVARAHAQQAAQAEQDASDEAAASDSDDASASDQAPLQLWLAPAVSLTAAPMTPLFGGAGGAAHAVGPLLLGLELEARFGGDARARSDVALSAYSAALSAAPLILRAPVQLSAGVAFRLGYARLSASANRPELQSDALDGLWLGPAAQLALQLPLAASTGLRFAVEAGYHLRPIVGHDELGRERFALRGAWLSLSIGIALPV